MKGRKEEKKERWRGGEEMIRKLYNRKQQTEKFRDKSPKKVKRKQLQLFISQSNDDKFLKVSSLNSFQIMRGGGVGGGGGRLN